MTYEEMKGTLEGWLGELRLWGDKGEYFRFSEYDNREGGKVIFCTHQNRYAISFYGDRSNYLGCVASCRTERPGETWTRGSDLPDGKFSRDTYNKILRGILGYELVTLAPVQAPIQVEGEITELGKKVAAQMGAA